LEELGPQDVVKLIEELLLDGVKRALQLFELSNMGE
jgi:hypothetical protein